MEPTNNQPMTDEEVINTQNSLAELKGAIVELLKNANIRSYDAMTLLRNIQDDIFVDIIMHIKK